VLDAWLIEWRVDGQRSSDKEHLLFTPDVLEGPTEASRED